MSSNSRVDIPKQKDTRIIALCAEISREKSPTKIGASLERLEKLLLTRDIKLQTQVGVLMNGNNSIEAIDELLLRLQLS